ncbi:fatty acid desaturase 6 [Trichechus manatus latirostris]|uniref:Fatty acid desaturase 6 n=1 Tax=Trichechus manatus latirostris TaxID=127582 RepID=A0A2Y9DGG8_TRIMA|nr:fatty acid desaturase 6 [Trichechus manatus latirostris]
MTRQRVDWSFSVDAETNWKQQGQDLRWINVTRGWKPGASGITVRLGPEGTPQSSAVRLRAVGTTPNSGNAYSGEISPRDSEQQLLGALAGPSCASVCTCEPVYRRCARSGPRSPCKRLEALGRPHQDPRAGAGVPRRALTPPRPVRPRSPPAPRAAPQTHSALESLSEPMERAGRGLRGRRGDESLQGELEALVQDVVRASSWWERHGVDCAILALSLLAVPAGFLFLRFENILLFALGITILGVCHYTLTVKGSHLATHRALTESKRWSKIWELFFVEVCTGFTAEYASYGHVKMHHGYTNVIGMGDSSTWKLPGLNRYVYMFLAPFSIPVITPLVALQRLREVELWTALRTLGLISLGLYSHYWLLLNVSGFKSPSSALACMFATRSLLAHPYLHVNIFQHIGLPMFSLDKKPRRIHMMSLGVLNLPRSPLLDWAFGHSLISCHVEHHFFPRLSDNMCLKVKPVVSQFLQEKQLPYNEDSYLARFRLFLSCYEELMVQAPPITELVGLQ